MERPPSKTPEGRRSLADIPLRKWVILGSPELAASHARRLAELGLRAGSRVCVLVEAVGGGRVVAVGGVGGVGAVEQGRVALDRSTCRRLPVRVERRP